MPDRKQQDPFRQALPEKGKLPFSSSFRGTYLRRCAQAYCLSNRSNNDSVQVLSVAEAEVDHDGDLGDWRDAAITDTCPTKCPAELRYRIAKGYILKTTGVLLGGQKRVER